ncbi:MAG: class I SAM-dependent methyltransferase [Tepidisphaeraceae bacterium]|jgi:ubiquinone/menaquinone biosynthesis C-methylase UbiE
MKSKPPTHWNKVAAWYDQLVGEQGSEFHRQIVIPGALRLMKLTAGEAALDVACGQGVLCRALAERGIIPTGVDAAKTLIESARQRGPATIHYHVADARHLEFLPENHFAAAACLLAIQNIQPLAPVISGVARLLKPRGKFVIVMVHPCFRGAKQTSWGWDDSGKIQYRRVDRYLIPRKTPIATHPGSNPDEYTWTFHRPVEAYIKAFRQSGLLVDAMEEWPSHKHSDSGPRAAAENTARKEIPLFMAIRALKIPSADFPHPDPAETIAELPGSDEHSIDA